MKELVVGLYQMEIITSKIDENLEKVTQTIQNNHNKEIDLWIVPEVFTTGFAYDDFPDLAQNKDESPTIDYLTKVSNEFGTGIAGTYLAASYETDSFCNIGFIISPKKGLVLSYQKIHLWGQEKDYFEAGNKVAAPINFENKANIGLAICYDLRFPEVYREIAKEDVDVLITTASWPKARVGHFDLLSAARALENTCYHIAVNRFGVEQDKTKTAYSGSSQIINPLGEVIAKAEPREDIVIAKLDPDLLIKTRERIPVLRDRKLM
ncbi:MAG: nitrilase-related carbon-nitrogen hydrolase [Candidatus Heimdallarchaeota archaeon]